MESTFFTSDTHFGHRMVATKMRGFKDIESHDNWLIHRWNNHVPPGAIVYHLGDFSLGSVEHCVEILGKLNGTIRLIKGNHDSSILRALKQKPTRKVEWVKDVYKIKHTPLHFWLSHYAHLSWPNMHRGVCHLFGHSHGNLKYSVGKSIDVGVDTNCLTPYSYDEVREILDEIEIEALDHHK